MNMAGFSADVSLYLDALSLVMMFVITFVGSLILLFSVGYMRRDEGFSRFFAYMDLFVGSMLILVLARNLLLLYLGWEGVGLCSYLLIGFWYKTEANARAAMKAFVVTRVGDTAMAIGLFLIVRQLGTLDIPDLLRLAPMHWPVGSAPAVAAAALLLGGAVGKSAQLPLQTWLPDAMAGPTPVSALIHAATMVTAGVDCGGRDERRCAMKMADLVALLPFFLIGITVVLALLVGIPSESSTRHGHFRRRTGRLDPIAGRPLGDGLAAGHGPAAGRSVRHFL